MTECLRAKLRKGNTGAVLIVSDSSVLPAGQPAEWQTAPYWRYQLFRLRADKRLWVTLIGLTIGLVALLIDGMLSIGAVLPRLVLRSRR